MIKRITKISILFSLLLAKEMLSCSITPNFSYTTIKNCGSPYIIKVKNTSNGNFSNNTKYWFKINGKTTDTIINLDSMELLLKKVGSNSVKLFVKDSAGCIDSTTSTNITVNSNAPTILDQTNNYNYQPTWTNCVSFITDPDTFTLKLSSADTLKKLKIIWGDGNSDTIGNDVIPNTIISHFYQQQGDFTIKIITTNGACVDTIYGLFFNQRTPTAGIIGPPSGGNRGCVPHSLKIKNNSNNISSLTTFVIEWGDGESTKTGYQTAKDSFIHIYKKGLCSGVIKLTASNVCGSSFTTWNPIDISDKDKAKWSHTPTCNPTQDYIFKNISSDLYCLIPDIKEYFWDFGDGTTNGWIFNRADQRKRYAKEGDYTITLIAKNSCGFDTFKEKIMVYYNPIAKFSFDQNRGCNPLIVNVIDTSSGRENTRLWTITEGNKTTTSTDSILKQTFTTPGTHTITLKVSNKCNSSSLTQKFIVNDKPKSNFTMTNAGCKPLKVNFNNTTNSYFSNANFTWDFGDNSSSNSKNPQQKIYSNAGVYSIKLVVNDSCGTDTIIKTLTVYDLPQANFSIDTAGCTFDSLKITNTSTNSNLFNWNFGNTFNKTTTSTNDFKYSYNNFGNFTITMVAGTSAGCKDTTSRKIRIKPGAKADFTIDKTFGCAPATFNFKNTSLLSGGFFWYINNQLSTQNQTLSALNIDNDSTILKIKLIAISTSSCQGDSIEKTIFTPKNPKAIIENSDSGCAPLKIQTNNLSEFSNSYLWNFNSNEKSTLKNPSTIFNGSLVADTIQFYKLKVKNWAGCVDSTIGKAKIFALPKANFDINETQGCSPLNITSTNISLTNNSKLFNTLYFRWKLQDSLSTSENFSDIFYGSKKNDTVYKIQLNVTSTDGCKDSTTKNIKVFADPETNFILNKYQGCYQISINSTNQTKTKGSADASKTSFTWNWGNGQTSFNQNFSNTYFASNFSDTVYKITLIASSEFGCKDTLEKEVTVFAKPNAIFSLNQSQGCTPLIIETRNLSTSKNNLALNYKWSFNRNIQSTKTNDTIIYTNKSDNYKNETIELISTSFHGCKDTALEQIIVFPKPKVNFNLSATSACAPAKIDAIDNSINANKNYWGINEPLFNENPVKTFHLPGIFLFDTVYNLYHQVESPEGCWSDTISKAVSIFGKPQASFEIPKDSSCSAEKHQIKNNSLGAVSYTWDFGNGSNSLKVNPTIAYNLNPFNQTNQIFKITLTVNSSKSCKDTVSKNIFVVNKPIANIILDKYYGCSPLAVNFKNPSSRFSTIKWDFGDNASFEGGDSITHIFTNNNSLPIVNQIKLTRSLFNCKDSMTTIVTTHPIPNADFRINRPNLCDAGFFEFNDNSKNRSVSIWSINETVFYGQLDLNTTLSYSFIQDTVHKIKLSVENNYGCKDSLIKPVILKPKMKIAFYSSPGESCEKGMTSFINQSKNAVRYLWKFGDNGFSNEINPQYIYKNPGDFSVKLYGYDRDGCVDSSTNNFFQRVLALPNYDISYLPLAPKLPNAIVNFIAFTKTGYSDLEKTTFNWDFENGDSFKHIGSSSAVYVTYYKKGLYFVSVKISNKHCSSIVRKSVYIDQFKPIANFLADTLFGCAPLKVKFTNLSEYSDTFIWNFGDATPESLEKNPIHFFNRTGTFEVTLTAIGEGGLSIYKRVKYIVTLGKPSADFNVSKKFLSIPNAIFKATNESYDFVSSQWSVTDSLGNEQQSSILKDPSFNINQVGRFNISLIVSNSNGCVDTLIKPNYIRTEQPGYAYVPSAFSPNKNNMNDGFKPELFNVKDRNYTFQIFTRWGEKIFETSDINGEWDGTYNEKNCSQEVYVWIVYGEFANNETFSRKGTLTLLR